MHVTGITRVLVDHPMLRTVLESPTGMQVSGLLRAARPAVFAAIAEASDHAMLIVTAHPQEAARLAEELTRWTSRSVLYFPPVEALPYERVRLDRYVLSLREECVQALLHGEAPVIVSPARALLQPVSGDQEKRVTASVVAKGDRISVDGLIGDWVHMGYAETSLVDQVGTFARRGGVVDVYPAGDEYPVRIELFGHEVESLRSFDPSSQRSILALSRVEVAPISAIGVDARAAALEALTDIDTSSMNADAKTRWHDDLALLNAGAPLDELTVFVPYLLQHPCSLAQLLPLDARVMLDDPSSVERMETDLWEQALDLQRGMEESGDLPRNLRPALLAVDSMRDEVAHRRCVKWLSGSDESGTGIDWTGMFQPARSYRGRLRAFTQDLAAHRSDRTVLVSMQHERVLELLDEEGVPGRGVEILSTPPERGVTVVPGTVAEGWRFPDAGLVLLSDHEIFGHARARTTPRPVRAAREVFFSNFSPGDYVVHLEHGIGRFDGVTRMEVEGSEREYALVQYAGSDRVYVPSDQLERLTRYIGIGDTPPPLNKLGGGEWQRARQRAQQAADEIAGELIDIYAKRAARPGHSFNPDTPWQHELETSFPYIETADQARAVQDVKADMEAERPMDRLVCADVGYGKTEVAVRAAFKAVMSGSQVAMLVPTTILAQQHFETFRERFAAFPVKVEVLSRFRTAAQQRDILHRLEAGELDIVIGTHRLLAKDVHFRNLGLLVIDEEQRFGVRHKEQLKKLRESIDVLTLTATPIPRTLHMGLVGIREISVIETPPEGRLPVKTYLQPFEERLIREAILRELDRDGQVYLVHNKVATIDAMAERVRALVPEANVVVGHGQMDESQLERVMIGFAHQQADVLISSTIIENGLDIPNVNTIIVNHAHRLGLTQLYQLRGRVGRSQTQAYAYLLYPRDVRLTHEAMQRMEAVFEAQDLGAGFTIAMRDLEIRGAGNLLGAQQSGHAAAIGFDLYTRMISDAVERARGHIVEEPKAVTLQLPLRMYLPHTYIPIEAERLSYYRRLAAVSDKAGLEDMSAEIRDRFGIPPPEVENLFTSVGIKIQAHAARVQSVSLTDQALIVRSETTALYDRVSLYRRYGMNAKVSTNVLRIARGALETDWVQSIETILDDMIRLQPSARPQTVGA